MTLHRGGYNRLMVMENVRALSVCQSRSSVQEKHNAFLRISNDQNSQWRSTLVREVVAVYAEHRRQ